MVIDIANLRFSYGNHPVLGGVDCHAESGEVVCVLGRNGAGKSTLFKCLLGFYSRYEGTITVDGKNLRGISQKELCKRIAYVPQSSSPVFDYSVFDVVCMGRTSHTGLTGVPKAHDEEVVFQTMEELGIGYLATSGYGHISGGERQMVLIARALVQQAGVLVMDEPTANLDFGNQHKVLEAVEHLRDAGYLVIMSTHNPQHALSYATKVAVMDGGRFVCQGDPLEVLDEKTLERIYGIDIELVDVARRDEQGSTRVCLTC